MRPAYRDVKFVGAWLLLCAAKVFLAWRLPLFGDEAFYAWESMHPAWAYSDLPAMTAWLAWLGTSLAGPSALGLRWPFLLLGAAMPWLVRAIARREFGEEAGRLAGWLALGLPLASLSGLLALPDVPLLLACLLCLDALLRLLRQPGFGAWLELALGLALGALTHYRFALALVFGLVGLLLSAQGRALLRRPACWLVLSIGALAWAPLLLWNAQHGEAGLAFQFVDRHPWALHGAGVWWWPIQLLMVPAPLFLLLLLAVVAQWRNWRSSGDARSALLLGSGGLGVFAFALLAFFADSDRVSFHWPQAGWLALTLVAAPPWAGWNRLGRGVLALFCVVSVLAMLSWFAVVANAGGRERLAAHAGYPDNFSGWSEATAAVRAQLAGMPPDTRVVADNFMLAAQLAFALQRRDIDVLDHPLNGKHGRAVQLEIWQRRYRRHANASASPFLLVLEDTASEGKDRLAWYHQVCRDVAAFPAPQRVLNLDRGRKRFLLYVISPSATNTACVAPALAWIDTPAANAVVTGRIDVAGWAFKDGVGLRGVELMVDGEAVATAEYGRAAPHVAEYWRISTDAAHPHVGFAGSLDTAALPVGDHVLGLRLHGNDGSVEDLWLQPLQVARQRR